jgi:hypothetical protein
MALMHLGLNDLRELFTPDIESVRMRRGKLMLRLKSMRTCSTPCWDSP